MLVVPPLAKCFSKDTAKVNHNSITRHTWTSPRAEASDSQEREAVNPAAKARLEAALRYKQQVAEQKQQKQDARDVGRGNSGVAANWLQTVDSSGLISQLQNEDLSMDAFTSKLEGLKREQGAVIQRGNFDPSNVGNRTRQMTEQMAQEMEQQKSSVAPPSSMAIPGALEDAYSPIVATWGVFPRPKNISKAYGGGRKIDPRKSLESDEESQKRLEEVRSAMAKYRKAVGIDVDEESVKEASKLADLGKQSFDRGDIRGALENYSAALDLVPLRSRVGGEVALRKAICLDSLGKNKEAYDIYVKIQSHDAPGVSKAAKRMIFGFKAAENLKMSNFSYSAGDSAWEPYFSKFTEGQYQYYKPSQTEEEQDTLAARAAAALAVLVMVFPLLCIGVLIAKSHV